MLNFQLADQGANSSLISYSSIPNTAGVRYFCPNYALLQPELPTEDVLVSATERRHIIYVISVSQHPPSSQFLNRRAIQYIQ
jgi:hypothetical protein